MTKKIISILTLTALTTTAAYAGPNCGKMRTAYQQDSMIKPAIMAYDQAGATSGGYSMIYATHHGEDVSKSGGYPDAEMSSNKQSVADVVDTAIAAGSFNTLVKAVQAAGLVETLKGDGPFTVFAPTDEAFEKLPEGTLDGLLADKEKLTKVLTYHVVSGKIMADDLVGKDSVDSLEGSAIPSASLQVSQADIEVSNGTIHAIDEVLIPQM